MDINEIKQNVEDRLRKMKTNVSGFKISDLSESLESVVDSVGRYVENAVKDSEMKPQALVRLVDAFEAFAREIRGGGVGIVPVKVKKLTHFEGELPSYQSDLASGFDIRAQLTEKVTLQHGERFLVPTGLSFEIPAGYELQARPRSGWAIREGVSLVNSPGTIDADYRGEVCIIVINHGQQPVEISNQDRIAQLVLCPVVQADLQEVTELSDTHRGDGGFGSTGKN